VTLSVAAPGDTDPSDAPDNFTVILKLKYSEKNSLLSVAKDIRYWKPRRFVTLVKSAWVPTPLGKSWIFSPNFQDLESPGN